MSESVDVEAKTVDQAIEQALKQLGCSYDDVELEIISRGGMLQKAKIKATLKGGKEPYKYLPTCEMLINAIDKLLELVNGVYDLNFQEVDFTDSDNIGEYTNIVTRTNELLRIVFDTLMHHERCNSEVTQQINKSLIGYKSKFKTLLDTFDSKKLSTQNPNGQKMLNDFVKVLKENLALLMQKVVVAETKGVK